MQDMHRTVMLEQPGAKQCPASTLKALLSIVLMHMETLESPEAALPHR
jgi:hypothetical protein